MSESASAMVLDKFNQPLEQREFPLPHLNEGELLVKISASGVCGSDVHMWLGKDPRLRLPMILGHEGIGRIAKLYGERNSVHGISLREGDLIIWNRGVTCGRCYFCVVKHTPALCPNRWVYGITTNCADPPYLRGCYAEYILLTTKTDILKIEADIDPAILVSAGCSGATMAHAFDLHSPDVGDIVVVQGPGPLGIFAVAFAKARGASEIIVIGGTQSRLELCRKFGATLALNRNQTTMEERRQKIMDLTNRRGADIVIEATGSSEAVKEGVGLVRNGGCYLVTGFGNPEGKVELDCFADISRKNIWLQGVWVSDTKHLLEAVRLVIDNADAFASLAVDKFPLTQATQALEAMRDRKTMKGVIVPT
jgi:threonine dehydrogenase-like Zn-dependent dehydrogenase